MKVHFDPDHPEHPDPSRRTEVYKLQPSIPGRRRGIASMPGAFGRCVPRWRRGGLSWSVGEPGLGKSQLARAAAHILNVPFLCQVINARCECTDLLYTYDAVSRLAQAQVMGSASQGADWADKLTESRFVLPGIL